MAAFCCCGRFVTLYRISNLGFVIFVTEHIRNCRSPRLLDRLQFHLLIKEVALSYRNIKIFSAITMLHVHLKQFWMGINQYCTAIQVLVKIPVITQYICANRFISQINTVTTLGRNNFFVRYVYRIFFGSVVIQSYRSIPVNWHTKHCIIG